MKLKKKLLALITFLKGVNYKILLQESIFFSKFFLLVIVYLLFEFIQTIGKVILKVPFIGKFFIPLKKVIKTLYSKVTPIFNTETEGEISSLDLVILATRHLKSKMNRTIITIGGMAIGFGAVIFLLSLGYGVEKLVVSRVARLGEMKQTDVTIGQATSLSLDDKSMEAFKNIEGVDSVIPLVSVVSKVTYNNSVSDAIAYGVTRKFLDESAIQPSKGKIFEDGEILAQVSQVEDPGEVAGVQIERITGAKINKQVAEVTYSLHPLIWKAVYKEPSEASEIIGYTKRDVGERQSVEVWGNGYDSDLNLPTGVDYFENEYSPWVKDTFPLWKEEECAQTDYDCVDGEYMLLKDGSLQQLREGYITENDLSLERYKIISDSYPLLSEGEVVDTVEFSFKNDEKIQIYSEAKNNAQMLTMFSGQENSKALYTGELIFGESYYSTSNWGKAGKNENGKTVGYWIRAKLPLWRQLDCTDCAELFLQEVDAYDRQVHAYAFIPANVVVIEDLNEPMQIGQVLGEATESASVASGSALLVTADSIPAVNEEDEAPVTEIALENGSVINAVQNDDGTVDWVSISSASGTLQIDQIANIPFADNSQLVTLVNRAMLNVLGISESNALGQKFEISLSLDSDFFKADNYQAKSETQEFTIIGVIPEEKTPAYYLPFSDIKNLGVDNYSQLKVVVKNQNDLKTVRKEIESLGFRTASVVDTVDRINSLFNTIRLALSVLGFIALGVAALGMFNTLTVSLLEKTREVGLMKAIGMKSNEVKRLFLAESIIMGLSGGIFGLFLGIGLGYGVSMFISTISIFKGSGFINLVFVPVYLALGILLLSFVVGVATGLYPSYRATKISALNALRYE